MAERHVTSAERSPTTPQAIPGYLIPLLGYLQTIAPMSIDMYLPALPTLTTEFKASQASLQLTLSGFLMGFAAGQLFWGPVGDRFGRRVPMALGLILYLVASSGCAAATGVDQMVMWRALQALGGCAAPVLASAIARDVFDREANARAQSLMGLVGSLAPLLAPIIGGQVLRHADWRMIFWVQSAFALVALLGLLALPETLAPARRRPLNPVAVLTGYAQLLANRRYMGYALSSAAVFGGMFAYISGTPFVYIVYFGVPAAFYGLLFGLNVVGMMSMNLLNSRLGGRRGLDAMLRTGCAIAAVAGLLLVLVGRSGVGGLPGLVIPIFLFVSTVGLTSANGIAGALGDFPERAGAAAALIGTIRMGAGAFSGVVVGWLADGTPRPMTLVIGCCGAAALAFNLWLLRPRS